MIEDSELVNALLRHGLIDQTVLKEGVERARQSGRPLYETLIFGRLASEERLVKLVGDILKVPVVAVVARDVSAGVRALVPASMARRNRVIPLQRREAELVLGMVDPLDVLAMDEIATHTGIDIHPVLVGPAAFEDALDALYGVASDTDDAADVLAAFDEFDVRGMMDEVMAGDEWSDMFNDKGPAVEDSAAVSRDMRDRPSTDVLAEDDIDAANADSEPELIEEVVSPPRTASPYAVLDHWEVDGALDGRPGKTTEEGSGESLILTVEGAEEFFRADRIPPEAVDAPNAPEVGESEVGEPTGPLHLELPDDVDADSLARALAALLVEKGLLTADEIILLARQFKA